MIRRLPWRDVAAMLYVVVLAAMFVAEAIVTRGIVGQYPSDGTRLMYIMREYLVGSLHAGRLPIWNPFIQFGAPFMADIQWAVFYPLNLLFLGLPSDLAYNLFIGLHVALAGVFTYLLARHWNLSRPAAMVAGTAFMLSGRMVTSAWGGTVNVVSAVAWLPLVVLLFDRTLTTRRHVLWGGLTALAVAVEILSGHPQHTFFTLAAMVALAAWRSLERSTASRRYALVALPLVALVAILATSFSLASIQIQPTYEAMRLSTRVFEWKLVWPPPPIEGSYNPLRLATWLVPDLFGNAVGLRPAATDWLSLVLHELHSHEFPAYVGVLPLLLALFSLTVWRTSDRIRFLWVLAGVAMLFALGDRTPVYGLAYAAVPPFRPFRVPARFLTLVVFSLALLAGFGADALLADAGRRARSWSRATAALAVLMLVGVGVALVFRDPLLSYGQRLATPLFATRPAGQALSADGREHLIAAAFGLTLYSVFVAAVLIALSAEVFRQTSRRTWSAGVIAGAIVTIACLDLGIQAKKYTTSESMTKWFAQSAPIMDAIRAHGPAEYEYTLVHGVSQDPVRPNDNVFIHEGLRTAGGYESFELATYRPLRDRLDAELRRGSPYLADVFGIRFIASDVPLAIQQLRQIESTSTAVLYENGGALPRAYVVGRARSIPAGEAALELLGHEGVRPGDEVLVEAAEPIAPGIAGPAGRAAVVAETPEEIQLTVSADRDGYLVLNDTFYPGWTATVDDRATSLVRANGHVRAVGVSAGQHRVVMRFAPTALERGMKTSAIIAAVTALVMAVGVAVGR